MLAWVIAHKSLSPGKNKNCRCLFLLKDVRYGTLYPSADYSFAKVPQPEFFKFPGGALACGLKPGIDRYSTRWPALGSD